MKLWRNWINWARQWQIAIATNHLICKFYFFISWKSWWRHLCGLALLPLLKVEWFMATAPYQVHIKPFPICSARGRFKCHVYIRLSSPSLIAFKSRKHYQTIVLWRSPILKKIRHHKHLHNLFFSSSTHSPFQFNVNDESDSYPIVFTSR